MQLGMVGLGRMGANILRRAMRAGIAGAGFDRDAAAVAALAAEGARGADSLPALVALLPRPRTVWVMLPAGAVTEAALAELHGLLEPGDTIIEGGNSLYKDSMRRAAEAAARGLRYLDVGTSGGVWGLERGYCLMIGGAKDAVRDHDALWRALAPGEAAAPPTPGRRGDPRPPQGYVHCGPAGAGHFAKMVHNGIEYGMMQAMAEGLDLLRRGPFPGMALEDVTEAWRRGSVVSSWLLDLTAQALAADPGLAEFSGTVSDSGEGRWTVDAAVEFAVPAPVLSAALWARFRSRGVENYADKALSAMRKGFGGHLEPAPQKDG